MHRSAVLLMGLMAICLTAVPLLSACAGGGTGTTPTRPGDQTARPLKTPPATSTPGMTRGPHPTGAQASPAGPQAMINCAAVKGTDDWAWSEAAGQCIRKEDGTWLWQGFHHEWDDTSHRLRDLGSEVYDIQYDFDPSAGVSTLSGKLKGNQPVGTCADDLEFRALKKGIKTGVAEFRHGSIDAVVIGGDVDQYIENTFPKQIPLDDLDQYDNVTIFMRGFEFEETGSQVDGGTGAYPIRGIGLKVDHVQRLGNMLQLDLHIMLHPAPKPLNTTPTPDSWSYRVRYDYTIAGGNSGEFAFATGHSYYHGPHTSADSGQCPNASAADRQTGISGTGKQRYNQGVVVFRGFYLKVNGEINGQDDNSGISGNPLKYLGRLVRQIDVKIDSQSYDWNTGEVTFTPNLYFCNHSAAQYAMNTYYQGFYTLLQFNDPGQWAETTVLSDAGGGKDHDSVGDGDDYAYSAALKQATFASP